MKIKLDKYGWLVDEGFEITVDLPVKVLVEDPSGESLVYALLVGYNPLWKLWEISYRVGTPENTRIYLKERVKYHRIFPAPKWLQVDYVTGLPCFKMGDGYTAIFAMVDIFEGFNLMLDSKMHLADPSTYEMHFQNQIAPGKFLCTNDTGELIYINKDRRFMVVMSPGNWCRMEIPEALMTQKYFRILHIKLNPLL